MKDIFLKILILFLAFPIFLANAQEKKELSLTITPPLIKVNLSPDQIWSSSIKVVNNNPEDLNIFVKTMDFKSGKEGGVIFLKEKEELINKKFLLSQWIEISTEPILIPAFQSKQIPFTIRVPSDAEPGGKYAAILIGTKPPQLEGTAIKITPLVSSLILATVRGEIREEIWLREFSTNKKFFQKPNVQFTLKIENIGNVHIQPQGEIKIFNMFGKEKGVIPINQKTEYGNILPQSSRKWNFSWERDDSLFETGKYKAILTLVYGGEMKQAINKEINFWIIPLVPAMVLFGVVLIFFGFVFLLIRIYVKRTVSNIISLPKKEVLIESEKPKEETPFLIKKTARKFSDIIKISSKISLQPQKIPEKKEAKPQIKKRFFGKKIILWIIILIFVFGILLMFFYFKNGLKEDKNYQISVKEEGEISPSQITQEIKEKIEPLLETEKLAKEIDKNSFSVIILNGSGIKGLANKAAEKLKKEEFRVERIGNAQNFNYQESLIKYKKGKEKEGQFLNRFFGNKFKLEESLEQKEDIIIIIGKDFTF